MVTWVKVYRRGVGFETLRLESCEEARELWAALDTYLTVPTNEVTVGHVTVYPQVED